MRFVIIGAGAVGGVIGGRLAEHGHDVVLVARGPHREALGAGGLRLDSPAGSVTVNPPVAAGVDEVDWADGDLAVVATKSQDSAQVLSALAAVTGGEVPVCCAQNGVENERAALRLHRRVYAMCVMLPGAHLEPGVVQAYGAPLSGLLDVGRYPAGVDEVAEELGDALEMSGFSSQPRPDVMRWKYAKLLLNLGNALDAACGPGDASTELYARARAEGEAALAAAGIAWASPEEEAERRGELIRLRPIDGRRRGGGSTWQSLARATGSVEVDALNGEIVLLGRLHGVPTPVNALLQRTAWDLARRRADPGSVRAEDLLSELTTA